jgi:predicted dehydrogenase
MAKVGIGIIGCGKRIRGVVQQVLNAANEEIEILALHDPAEDSIKATKEKFNNDAVVYDDYRALVKDPKIDWIFIGSWNCFHKEQTIAAFEAGKNVFCEKPLATNVNDCIAMFDAWKKSGKMFSIGFTLRYSPHYIKIKEIISSGRIGNIVSMEFNETLEFNHGGYIHGDWRRKTDWAGTHLLEKCCHDVDLVNWMVESTASRVASFGGTNFFLPKNEHYIKDIGKNKDGKDAFGVWEWHEKGISPFGTDKDIIDNQVAIIEFANQIRTTFHTNCSCAPGMQERRMYFCGTEGTLKADVINGTIELKRIGFDTELEDLSTDSKGGHGGGDSILGESVAESLLKGAAPRTSLEDGLKSAFTCFGIDESMNTGKMVDMAPYWQKAGIQAGEPELAMA